MISGKSGSGVVVARTIAIVVMITSLSAGCSALSQQQSSCYESNDTHADCSPVTPQEKTERAERRKAECYRLYKLLGDRSLTAQQIEAIRVSMNAHFCAGLVP
jgi:hypothetical protein